MPEPADEPTSARDAEMARTALQGIESGWRRPAPAPASPARLNAQGREIWFDRVMWSYMPCHWKGWVYPTLIILPAALIGLLLTSVHPLLIGIPIFAAWALVMWLCERHSPSRA